MDTVLDIKAVEAMCKCIAMGKLMRADDPRHYLEVQDRLYKDLPDWSIAALNCTNDADILPMAMHTFLSDWKPEVKK